MELKFRGAMNKIEFDNVLIVPLWNWNKRKNGRYVDDKGF